MILILDSFYTGSHKFWADNLSEGLPFQNIVIGLPGGSWKWRMESGGIELAEKIKALNITPTAIIATSMINLPQLYAFCGFSIKSTPCFLYFHENQLAYPVSDLDSDKVAKRDNHYGFIQIQSALFATLNIFNSKFNQSSFAHQGTRLLQALPKNTLLNNFSQKMKNSSVIYPGIKKTKHFRKSYDTPVLLWNHRWEHDKNPELFIEGLRHLKKNKKAFKLIVLGKGTEKKSIQTDLLKEFNEEIIHIGYVSSKKLYYELLNQSTHLPVTSKHDFFGISVAEAMESGISPILPNHQAYPEHTSNINYLYDYPNGFKEKLLDTLNSNYEKSNFNSEFFIQNTTEKWVDLLKNSLPTEKLFNKVDS